jgi:hypothetical protein
MREVPKEELFVNIQYEQRNKLIQTLIIYKSSPQYLFY